MSDTYHKVESFRRRYVTPWERAIDRLESAYERLNEIHGRVLRDKDGIFAAMNLIEDALHEVKSELVDHTQKLRRLELEYEQNLAKGEERCAS